MNNTILLNYILVGFGGSLGALTRFQIGKIINKRIKISFPIATFFINITGAILLGIVAGSPVTKNLYLLLADGFLGAYTTFSTFMYEGLTLYSDNKKLNAFLYIITSIFLGIIGFLIGYKLGS